MRTKGGAQPFSGLQNIDLQGLRFRLIDAENQVVGRLAAQVSLLLQGKDKPTYDPTRDRGDVCVVINASKAVLTGRKWDDKTYVSHTGAPGGRKEIVAKEVWRKDPTDVLRRAVADMLPRNALRKGRLRKLRIFEGSDHAFRDFPLTPWSAAPRALSDERMGWPLPPGLEPMNPLSYARRMRGSRWSAPPEARQHLPAVPDLSFDDLLTADERQLVAAALEAGGSSSGSKSGGGSSSGQGQGRQRGGSSSEGGSATSGGRQG